MTNTTPITRAEIMTALGLGKYSKSAFWRYTVKYPHAFALLERGIPPKPNLYDRAAFVRWMQAREQVKGK